MNFYGGLAGPSALMWVYPGAGRTLPGTDHRLLPRPGVLTKFYEAR